MIVITSMDNFQNQFAMFTQMNGLDELTVQHGPPPTKFPCLAAFTTAGNRVIACYVYPEQARKLLAMCEGVPETFDPNAVYRPERDSEGKISLTEDETSPADLPEPVDPTKQATEFNKHLAAMVMAIVEELVEVGVTKPERFEATFAKHLARADQSYAETLDNFRKSIQGEDV